MTELALAQQRAQLMVTQAVNAFVRAIEAVDAYLRGHSDFTAQLAVLLARQLGRDDPETLATLRTAAKLSQLGMIQLPKELLTKSGSLTPDERAQLERHVDYAREALAGIDFGLPVLEAMTQMHERLDGSGYPDHLQGENICPTPASWPWPIPSAPWSVPAPTAPPCPWTRPSSCSKPRRPATTHR